VTELVDGAGSYATNLRCVRCGTEYQPAKARVMCDCDAPLEQQYDLPRLAASKRGDGLAIREHAPGIWRYADLLPVADSTYGGFLGEGLTPLIRLTALSAQLGVDLQVKDEGQNPTGTFKVRGASVGVARLRELGWTALAMPTVGSGGSAWAAYCARHNVELRVGLPTLSGLPEVGLIEPGWYGAAVRQFPGDVAPAFQRMKAELGPDMLYVGAFCEPYRVEGDKTLLFEIYEQLSRLPDYLIWPTGGGVGLVGIAKAVDELRFLDATSVGQPLTLVAAQHSSGSPLADALSSGRPSHIPAAPPTGIAPGVWVGDPFASDYIIRRVRQAGNATGVTADDRDIQATLTEVARQEGVLLGPEGALAVAGAAKLVSRGAIPPGSVVVCVNTASFLRYQHLLGQRDSDDADSALTGTPYGEPQAELAG